LQGGVPIPNDQVIRLCRRSGGMLAPVITAEPTAKEVKAAVKLAEVNKREVKAFKVRLGYVKASAESPVFDKLYDYAESERLPVLFHTGDTAFSTGDLARSHPLTLDGLANKREELTIILCHFGNPWFEDVAELIYKHPNVYADISGLITGGAYAEKYADWLAKKISEAIYFAAGAEKIIFGTDYPVTRHSETLALVRRLEVDERDKEKILWRNAERVFGL
jgi:predicted TIM-barrel fold metal-dependent hydrolase